MDLTSLDPTTMPRSDVELVIQEWRAVQKERLELERVAKNIKERETALKSMLIEVFKEQKFEGMLIGGRITGLNTKKVATVDDKAAFLDYVKSSGQLDLLQFRLSTAAVDERKAEGIEVPGVDYIDVYDLFDRKS